jgi:FixJ family two-component response regulator
MAQLEVVCVVDDDESVRESVAGLLRAFDFDARQFASAEEFLAAPEQSAICLILDVTMPNMSGEELQLQLRLDGRRIPIVFITARAEPVLHARLLDQGATACLVKPFQEDALLEAVRRTASSHGART